MLFNTKYKVAVNDVELTYDEVGNVLTYGDKEFTWNSGRNLESIVDGDNNYSYTYDENGIRTSKTVNGVTTYYNTKDGVILSQSDGTNTMYFQYDTNGTPLGFIYNATQYFYMTNQMGDIIAITESDGNIIAQYVYDEWGKLLNVYTINEDNVEQSKVANANPLRYRGYYYDTETGYYYLQSRYYDASICRFINADIPEIAQMSKGIAAGTNLYTYCNNNPINNIDETGYWVGYIGISFNLIAFWGINGMVGLFFDGSTLALIFSFSYKCIGINISAGISGGFYPKYKNVDAFYKDKLGTISVFCVDVMMQTKGFNGKITGGGISISGPISIASISVSTHTKLVKIRCKLTQGFVKSLISKKNAQKFRIKTTIRRR